MRYGCGEGGRHARSSSPLDNRRGFQPQKCGPASTPAGFAVSWRVALHRRTSSLSLKCSFARKEVAVLTFDEICASLRTVTPGSELDAVVQRWDKFSHTVQINGKWRLTGFITCLQHLAEMMHAIEPSIEPNPPPWCYDPQAISEAFHVPLKELLPHPDGPGRSGAFWWHGEHYKLSPKCFSVVSALWSAPARGLWLDELLARVWKVRPAAIGHSDLRRVRTCASRIGKAVPGITVSVGRDRVTGRMRVWLSLA